MNRAQRALQLHQRDRRRLAARRLFRLKWAVALVAAAAGIAGCSREDEQIRRYRVTKPTAIPGAQSAGMAGMMNPHQLASEPRRLLGAIIPHGQWMWFFKMVGPPELIGKHKQAFESFISSIKFPEQAEGESGRAEPIVWKLPDGWQRLPGSGIRYATIRVGASDEALELSVTPLARSANTVLANVNRWRGQLGLEPVSEKELEKVTKVIRLDGTEATLVDITSRSAEEDEAASGAEQQSSQVPKSPPNK